MKKISDLDIKSKKYIIFDLDGTLIDSIGVWNITDQKLIYKYSGISVDLFEIQKIRDNFLNTHVNHDIYLSFCNYLIKKYHFKGISKEELLQDRWRISSDILENEMDYKEGVVPFIYRLKELGYTLILATMTTDVQIDIYTKKNTKMISQMNILEAFDYIIKKEDVSKKKPDPEIYLKVLDIFQANKEECLIFEDSYTGVLAAKNAGIEVVNIYDSYADIDRDKIRNITDYEINSYDEVLDYFNKKSKVRRKICQ